MEEAQPFDPCETILPSTDNPYASFNLENLQQKENNQIQS